MSFPDTGTLPSMSLTTGHGPLARDAADRNFVIDGPKHSIHFEPHPRRVRAELDGRTVLDTRDGFLLHETGIRPVLYIPIGDVDQALLERTDHVTHCPFKGDASYWSVRVGERVAENAVWGYETPTDTAPWLKGYVALYWDRMDRWLEEDEEVHGQLRDPYHRVDVRRSSRPVEIGLRDGGQLVARDENPLLLFETGIVTRAYLPPALLTLEPSQKRTICPYKGTATYWSVRAGDELLADAAWSYDDPLPGMEPIAGLVCVDHEQLEVRIA
ncbi:MAG: hypothetical protein JWP17_133 [Solirubrobacterales bacterium]|nr:hypothetical protein [Solirubrobacterales bacterium]